MSVTIMKCFRLSAKKNWNELIIQSWHPVLAITRNLFKFKETIILSKLIFCPFQEQRRTLRYVCNNRAKFQIDCKKLWEELIKQTF